MWSASSSSLRLIPYIAHDETVNRTIFRIPQKRTLPKDGSGSYTTERVRYRCCSAFKRRGAYRAGCRELYVRQVVEGGVRCLVKSFNGRQISSPREGVRNFVCEA
jgi:hypothetical protein